MGSFRKPIDLFETLEKNRLLHHLGKVRGKPESMMKYTTLILLLCCILFPVKVESQGLVGPKENVRWGSSTGGELLPGKTDSERWQLFQSNEKTLLGKTEKEVTDLFGKGGSGFEKNQLVYRITDWKRKNKSPIGTATDVTLTFFKGKVASYNVHLVHWD